MWVSVVLQCKSMPAVWIFHSRRKTLTNSGRASVPSWLAMESAPQRAEEVRERESERERERERERDLEINISQ